MHKVINTPGRASFAGETKQSPSFKDIAKMIMPSDREKALEQAVINLVTNLVFVVILIILNTIYNVLTPFIRPLLLALLFGSFLHPLKRTLSMFIKKTILEIQETDWPIVSFTLLPIIVVDKFMQELKSSFFHHMIGVKDFGLTILEGNVRSALAVALSGSLQIIIGYDSLMNFVMCINLIVFITSDITKASLSDAYLNFLIRSFILAQFCWLHNQILFFVLPIVILWLTLSWTLSILKSKLLDWYRDEEEVNEYQLKDDAPLDDQDSFSGIPDVEPPAQTNELVRDVYNSFIEFLEGCIDTISSCCVISLVVFIVIFTTIYLSFQIYSESLYLIEKVSTSANQLLNNSDLRSLLPDGLTGVQSLLDGAVNNTYQHGREWIRRSTRQLLNEGSVDDESSNSSIIEKQMIVFWDRAYGLWLNRADNQKGTHPYDWDRLFDALKSLDLALCAQIFKQNWDTLVSVMDSVILVLKSNLNLIISMLTATASLLLVGGNVLMNFAINVVIFTTTLYYLLCASSDQYKPIELIKKVIPINHTTNLFRAKRAQNKFIDSVDESINAVFTVSLKMMAFHGLSTWLLHRLFELEVVYIPAVISALFGAVPFIAPYWASVPACIDICLSGQWLKAGLLLLLATVPSSFVTTAFYSEIKGAGHPYLTGLAIAGGVFLFGIEGALFGPMLLVPIVYFMINQ